MLLGEKIHFRLYLNKEPHSCVRNGVPLEAHKGELDLPYPLILSLETQKGLRIYLFFLLKRGLIGVKLNFFKE